MIYLWSRIKLLVAYLFWNFTVYSAQFLIAVFINALLLYIMQLEYISHTHTSLLRDQF
jgi:hypothetical protein